MSANFHHDPNIRSYIKLRHEFNYIDASRPDTQPKHLADVHLTHRNMREAGDVPKVEGPTPDQYIESHRIINVSDPVWKRDT